MRGSRSSRERGKRMRRGGSLQGSGNPEPGLSLSLSTFPGSYKVATTKKGGAGPGERGGIGLRWQAQGLELQLFI